MLSIRSISLTDFGPFKDEQRIEFPARHWRVDHLWREHAGQDNPAQRNSLRALRQGDHARRDSSALHQIGNWETAKEKGKYGFKVVLEFEHEGFEVPAYTRNIARAPGVTTPETDIDYQQDCFLRKDGTVLGPDRAGF